MVKKTVLITGGTSGIGLSTIQKFLLELGDDVEVISISRSIDKINVAKTKFQERIAQVEFFQADVSKIESLELVYKDMSRKYNKIDVLINNAGNIIAGGLETLSFNDWDRCISNNLSSYFYVTKVFLPLLKKSDSPFIVNVSSISSRLSGASMGYSVAKAGVDMTTMCLARELSKYNIRVNCVNPGITKSGFQVHNGLMDEGQYGSFLEKISKDYLLGLGNCSDVSEMIYFLSSEKARWITGSSFVVDGGRSVNI